MITESENHMGMEFNPSICSSKENPLLLWYIHNEGQVKLHIYICMLRKMDTLSMWVGTYSWICLMLNKYPSYTLFMSIFSRNLFWLSNCFELCKVIHVSGHASIGGMVHILQMKFHWWWWRTLTTKALSIVNSFNHPYNKTR